MTKKRSITTNRTGGTDIHAQTVNAQDIIGRDKIVQEAPAPIATSLHQLPSPPNDFTGREAELNELLNNIEHGAIITGLRGMGGIGKTALALVLADRLKTKYPDVQFFLNLQGASDKPLSPIDAMQHVVRAYYPTAKLPDNEAELRALYLSVLSDQHALVFFDDARDAKQIMPLMPPATCLLLITSRFHFQIPGLQPKNLEQMSIDDARELILKIAPRLSNVIASEAKQSPRQSTEIASSRPSTSTSLRSVSAQDAPRNDAPILVADSIAKLCGYLPQALRAAASLLAVNEDLDPNKYIEALRDERTRLEKIGTEGIEIGVEASLNLSYARLSDEAKQVLAKLSVFPASFDAAAEEVVCEDKEGTCLHELLRLSLAQFDNATKRYQLHDLVNLFADKQLNDNDRHASQRRHAAYYEFVNRSAREIYEQGGEGITSGLAWFDREWPNIKVGQEWSAKHFAEDNEAASLCNAYPDWPYLIDLRLHPRERIRWTTDALNAAHQLKDRAAEGIYLGSLGNAYYSLGETRRAIEFYEQTLAIALEIGDKHNEGAWLGNLGDAYYSLGETRKAIEFHEQHRDIAREIDDRRGEGNALNNLGVAYAALGDTRKAIEFYEQRLVIAREIGDRLGEGNSLGNLGNAYYRLGEMRKAIEYHERALKVMENISDKATRGTILGNLGVAYSDLGERQRALEYYNEALAIAHESSDRRGEGRHLWNMADEFNQLGDRTQAIELAGAALKIYEAIADPNAEKVRKQLAEWRGETS